MLSFSVLLMALQAVSGSAQTPRATRIAMLDTHVSEVNSSVSARKVPTTTPILPLAPATPFDVVTTPMPAAPVFFALNVPQTFRFGIDTPRALMHDSTFEIHTGGKPATFTGLWDITAGLHADIRLGNLLFDNEVTSLRIIPISTTSTRIANQGLQPGFVIGLGTTW